MPANTLLAMATLACIRNLPNITDLGDLPYEVVRPILRKIENPQQLEDIEQKCPHIADVDAELWKAFLLRDTSAWAADRVEPSNPRSWHKLYKKMVRTEQRATEEQEKQLRLKMLDLSKQRELNKTGFNERLQVPREEAGKQSRWYGGQLNMNYRGNTRLRQPGSTDPRSKNGKRIMNSLRREQSNRPRPVAMTAEQKEAVRTQGRSQIQAAPPNMVRDKQRLAQQAASVYMRPPSSVNGSRSRMFAPTRSTVTSTNRIAKDAQRLGNPAASSVIAKPNVTRLEPGVQTPQRQTSMQSAPKPTITSSPPKASISSSPPSSTEFPKPLKRPVSKTSVLLPVKRRKL